MLKTERLRTFAFLLGLIKSIPLIALKLFYSILRAVQLATQKASEKLARIALDVYKIELSDLACPSNQPITRPSNQPITRLENLSSSTKIYNDRLKHINRENRELEDLLQLGMDAAQIEISTWNLLTNKIIPLKNYQLLFSLDSNTAANISQNFLDFVHPEDYKSVTQTILRCIEEKIDYNDEFRAVSPTGKTHWICASGKTYFNENGKATKIVVILKNIDDRLQAETSAINSEAKWRSLIQYSSEFITIIGSNNNSSEWAIEFVSFSIQRILGYVPFHLLGEDFLNLVHLSDLPHVITALQQVLREPDKIITIEYKYFGQRGSWYLIASSVSNHLNNSTIVGIVLNSRVVKELTQLERQDLLKEDGSRATVKNT